MEDGKSNGRYGAPAELHPLELLAVPVREWRVIAAALVIAVGLGVLLLAILPKTYASRTVLVLAGNQSQSPALLLPAQLGAVLPGLVGGGDTNKPLISAILKSRALQDSIAERLVPEGDSAKMSEVRHTIAGRTKVAEEPNGSFVVEVRHARPELAARIAAAFPQGINSIVAGIGSQYAVRRKEFLEQQLSAARDQLESSERRLVEFQQLEDAPELQEQARRTVETAAMLQQEIIQNEVRVAQLRRTSTPANPELQAALAELRAQREQLQRLTTGSRGDARLLLSLRESPELRAATLRHMREFTKDEQVYLSLTAALAETGIDVNNNLPVVSVLDAARVPLHPSWPNPRIILPLAVVLGLVLGLVGAFLRDYLRHARQDPDAETFFTSLDQLRGEVRAYASRLRPSRTGRSVPS